MLHYKHFDIPTLGALVHQRRIGHSGPELDFQQFHHHFPICTSAQRDSRSGVPKTQRANGMPQSSAPDVIASGSLRRLRGSHYSAQRAQLSQDALPLIQKDRSSNSTRVRSPQQRQLQRPRSIPLPVPYPPQPTYQPHQLVAVCFNHMTGRECGHCRQIDQGLRSQESVVDYQSLNETVGQVNDNRRYSAYSEKSAAENDEEEKRESAGPPPPVGLFDKRLSKLRLQILGLWGRTGTLALSHACVIVWLISRQF